LGWAGWEALRRLRELLARAGQGGWHGPVRSALRRLVEMEREGSPYAAEAAMLLEDLASEVRPAADAIVSAFTGDPSLASAAGRSGVSRVLVAALKARARGRGPEALGDVVAAIENMGAAGRGLARALAEAARGEPDAARSLVLLAARGRRGALAALAEAVEGAPWGEASLGAAADALSRELGVAADEARRAAAEEGVLGLARLLTGLRDAPRSVVAALLAGGYRRLSEALNPGLAAEAIHRPGWPLPASARSLGRVEAGGGPSGDGWAAAALLSSGEIVALDPRGLRREPAPRGAAPPIAAGRHGVAVAYDTGSTWGVALLRGGVEAWAEAGGEPVALSPAPWGLAALLRDAGRARLVVYTLEGASLAEAYTAELPGEPVDVAASPRSPGAAAAVARGVEGVLHVAEARGRVEEYTLDSRPVAALWTPSLGPVAVSSEYIHVPRLGRRLGLLVQASSAAAAAGGRYLLVAPAGRGMPFYLADPYSGSLSELRGGPQGPVERAALAAASTALLTLEGGTLTVYPLACSEACPPGEPAGHGLEHPGCGAACRAYREGRGPQGYIARLIGEARYREALAAAALLAERESWSPPARSIVDAALLGLRRPLLEASEERGWEAVAEALLHALERAEGRPLEEARRTVASTLGLQEPGASREAPAAPRRPAGEAGDPVEAVLAVRVGGLRGGPECRGEPLEARLSNLEPRELEGVYECCLLGCGGYGCVYRCRGPQGLVAVKTPRGMEPWEAASATVPEGLAARIAGEARVLMGLRHPNIVRLLGHGRGSPLLIYEYAAQGSLAWQLLKGWRPGLANALIVGVHLGDALRYIHSRGLVHGDVKPSNTLFSGGAAKLGDFSSATQLLTAATAASLPGTPGWRAPEQVYLDLRRRAVERGLENRIDVYQLGNLLLYLLTGESMDGEEAANPERLREALNRVQREELRRLLGEMLALEPWRRPSMEEAVKRLARIALEELGAGRGRVGGARESL